MTSASYETWSGNRTYLTGYLKELKEIKASNHLAWATVDSKLPIKLLLSLFEYQLLDVCIGFSKGQRLGFMSKSFLKYIIIDI